MFDSDVRARRARGTLAGRLLFAVLVLLAACINSFAATLPPATNGVIAFSGLGFVNPDGTGLTYTSYGLDPAWSPDGKKISYAVDYFDGQPYCGCIYVANADGSGLTQLSTPPDSTWQDRWPSWSPDGSRILFSRASLTSPWAQLYVMNSDGSNPVALPLPGIRPSWSPDGARIIYSWGGIVTANPDGTNATWVHEGFYPAWSRDGTRIAFSGYDNNFDNPNAVVYTANPDGSNVTQLTFGCLPSGCDDRGVAWSPDGTKLVFLKYANYMPDGVYVMNADGSGQTLLVADEWAVFPAWQPIPTAQPKPPKPPEPPKPPKPPKPPTPPTGPFQFTGFFSPLGPAGTLNVAKAGSAVPIKFSLGGNYGLNIFAAGSPSTQAVSCSGGSSVSGAAAANTPGKGELSYDAKSGQYTYVMKTEKAWANTCRTLTVMLTDGTSHSADFRFN